MKRRGLTLAETVLAAMLFSAIALAVMRILPAYFQSLEKQKRRTTACFLANRYMDKALANLYTLHDANLAPEAVHVTSEIGSTTVEATYTVSALSQPYAGTPPVSHLEQITVKVDFEDSHGPQQVKIETLAVKE